MMSQDASQRADHGDTPLNQVSQAVQKIFHLLENARGFANTKRDEIRENVLFLEKFCIDLSIRLAEKELFTTNAIPSQPIPRGSIPLFSEVTKGLRTKSSAVVPTKHILRVFPKTDADSEGSRITSEATKKMLTTKVSLKGLKVGARLKSINKGGVAVECRSKEEIQVLSKAINDAKVSLEVKPIKKTNPTFTMFLPGKDHDLEELRTDLITKNEFIPDEPNAIKLVHSWHTKQGNTVAVVEVAPEVYPRLVLNEFLLYSNWGPSKLREREPISQCYRCNRFGHKAHQCRFTIDDQSATRCARCGVNHENREQCEEELNCSNCLEYNTIAANRKWELINNTKHSARDMSCPCRIKAINKAKQNVDYGY